MLGLPEMNAFNDIDAYVAALPMENIDTDKIFPGQFLKTTARSGLGKYLFWPLRQDQNFVLNQSPWDSAEIIVALDNFGCGSSREHAPWALRDFGIRCIISPQIADIFYNNCIKNKILPINLPRADVLAIMAVADDAETARMLVSLDRQEIVTQNGVKFPFEIDPIAKRDLLSADDEIGKTLSQAGDITDFELQQNSEFPWMFQTTKISKR